MTGLDTSRGVQGKESVRNVATTDCWNSGEKMPVVHKGSLEKEPLQDSQLWTKEVMNQVLLDS